MSASDDGYRTSVTNVRHEIEADGYAIEAITNDQLKAVGLTPAALVVDEDLAGSDMSDNRLALIERYLAGHFVLSSGVEELRQIDDESLTDGSKVSYSGDRDHTDYRSTSLGQKALALDESGALSNVTRRGVNITATDVRGHD